MQICKPHTDERQVILNVAHSVYSYQMSTSWYVAEIPSPRLQTQKNCFITEVNLLFHDVARQYIMLLFVTTYTETFRVSQNSIQTICTTEEIERFLIFKKLPRIEVLFVPLVPVIRLHGYNCHRKWKGLLATCVWSWVFPIHSSKGMMRYDTVKRRICDRYHYHIPTVGIFGIVQYFL